MGGMDGDRGGGEKRHFHHPGLVPWCPGVGWMRWRRTMPQAQHVHPGHHELHYFERGSQTYLVAGREVRVPPQAVLLIGPGVEHGPAGGRLGAGEMWWMGWDLAHPAFLAELPREDRAHVRQDLRIATNAGVVRVGAAFGDLVRSFLACHRETGMHQRHMASGWLALMVSRLCLALADLRDPDLDSLSPPVSAAIAYMRRNLGEGSGVDEVAAHVGLAPRTLHQRFQRETGYTPALLWSSLRIEHAKQRLIESEATVTAIALDAGFSSSQYFATVFKRTVGCTPLAWRNRHR